MNYTTLLLTLAFTSSCSGIQNTIKNLPEQTKNNTFTIEKTIEAKSDGNEIAQVMDNIENSNEKKGSANNSDTIVNRIKTVDSVDVFHQNLKKRTFTEHQLWDELLEKHVSDDGKVNYSSFKKDHKELLGYVRILQVTYEKVNSVTERQKNETLAYWINAYNALTIDLILRHYPIKSIKDIKDPWDQKLWQFGEKSLSLNDIEHEILRKMNEPRIHFAIVCASVSCPKLQNKAYTADKLEEQLNSATEEFLADTSKNELSKDKIKISKIFKWFKKDFEKKGSLIDFLNQYSEVSISKKAKKSYTDYNWDLND